MEIIREQVTGSTVSQIDDLSTLHAGEFLSGDLFLISQQCLSNVSPDRVYEFNGKVHYNEYRSLNEKYNTLSDKFFNDSRPLFGFKSMAWEDEEHYSLANHVHNYSKVSCQPLILPSKDSSKKQEVSSIVTFNIDNKNVTLYMPKISIYEQPRPYIGQLKFMAIQSLPQRPNDIRYYSSLSFDGWVYPDGRVLDLSMFQQAYEAFGKSYNVGDEGENQFRIPALSNFIRMQNDFKDSRTYNSIVNEQKVILEHFHYVTDMYMSGNMTCDISIGTGRDTNNGPSTHSPNNIDNPNSETSAKLAFNFNNVRVDHVDSVRPSDASLDVQTYPSYNDLPVLMYIGEASI